MENSKGNRTILVRATPEMANWMHPQTDERKKLIQERVAAAKNRFSQRKLGLKSINTFSPRLEIKIGSTSIVINKLKSTTALKSVPAKKLPIQ